MILYKACSHTGVEDRHINFTLSGGSYSIDDFKSKVKVAVLQGLTLVIPEQYTFMASNSFFIVLGMPNNTLEQTARTKSTLHPGAP